MKFFVVGAGIWGSVMAERLASVLKAEVVVLEKRGHIGGNCHSWLDPETGIECHGYGSHIFHTSLPEVWEYMGHFMELTPYRHKVLTTYKGKVYLLPINLFTINEFYDSSFSPSEAEHFLNQERTDTSVSCPTNLEEKALSLIGRPLYEAFIKNYTHKQWKRNPKDLPASIIERLPFRTNYNLDYFNDTWQGVPKSGYFSLFKKMLSHQNITIRLNCDYASVQQEIPSDAMVLYTGKPDEFFQFKYGALEWRSLRFEWDSLHIRDFQGTAVMNYADLDVPFTRIHEFKHYHPEWTAAFQGGKTVICREYPTKYQPDMEAYYPVNDEGNNALYARYAREAAQIPHLIFGGRLGSYRYMNMDQTVADALRMFDHLYQRLSLT